MLGYHQFIGRDGQPYGSFEVFAHDDYPGAENAEDGGALAEGFYWWPCHQGCMPDGDHIGPFATAEEAKADALDCQP